VTADGISEGAPKNGVLEGTPRNGVPEGASKNGGSQRAPMLPYWGVLGRTGAYGAYWGLTGA
jgi:hypothetical protein